MPDSLLSEETETLVSTLVAVTLALAMTASLESVTRPVSEARVSCATAGEIRNNERIKSRRGILDSRVLISISNFAAVIIHAPVSAGKGDKAMATTAVGLSLLEAVKEIAPTIRENAAASERERRLSDQSVAAMKRAGFFRMTKPRAFGGMEI